MKNLDVKLRKLIGRNEPSSCRDDALKALKMGGDLNKRIAISNYNKWIKS
jgi:hypothetical protein